jgi:hypothetical protein
MKIFGRDPALWLALLGLFISAAGTFVFHFSTDQEGVLNGLVAAIMGVIVWRVTHDGSPALILGLAKAVFLTLAAFHFNIPADRQTILMGLLSAAVAMFVRTQVGAPVPPPTAVAAEVKVVGSSTNVVPG